MKHLPLAALAALSLVSAPAMAKSLAAKPFPPHRQAEAQALDLAKQLIAIRSVRGPGNKTIDAQKAVKAALIAGGWAEGDIEITPLDDTAYLIATWKGSDPKLKPLVISGHLDVVEANPKDWQRDPFTPVVENGYLFGRGASDMKLDAALAVSAMIDMRRAGFKPKRSIVLALSGDEETTMASSIAIVERMKGAELVLNVDADLNGVLDEATGKPLYWIWQGAEKSYADYKLTVTNPGGHSSMPRDDNAINQLSAALLRIAGYRFAPEQSDVTRAYFAAASAIQQDQKLASAMKAFAANLHDVDALRTLRANPGEGGKVSTTCVVTMINGGHAQNALPQRAEANVNCRIFPGHKRAEIAEELKRVIADPGVELRDVTEGAIESPASALRKDFVSASEKAIHIGYPGIPVVPGMATGASDCEWYRASGIDCYVASPVFMKASDYFSHGLNERVPLASIAPSIAFHISLLTDLAK